jgi:APA family basic amino acid/polyamine antiporter
MFQLPRVTWIRFVVWLILGLVLYFAYGYRHSTMRNGPPPAPEDEAPVEQLSGGSE